MGAVLVFIFNSRAIRKILIRDNPGCEIDMRSVDTAIQNGYFNGAAAVGNVPGLRGLYFS